MSPSCVQEDFNAKKDDVQEKLDNMKLEQAKYNQSKEIKSKQIVSMDLKLSICTFYHIYIKTLLHELCTIIIILRKC